MVSALRAIGLGLWMSAAIWPGAQARELKLNHQFQETDGRHRAARVFVAEVRKYAPEITISIHPSSQLKIAPEKQLEALLDGRIELAILPIIYTLPTVPELAVLSLPAIPANAEAAALLRGSEFEDLVQAFCAEKGIRILAWWWFDGGIASRKRPVTGPESIKGMVARSSGGDAFNILLAAAGAKVVRLPIDEMNLSMKSEKLEVSQASYETLMNYKVYEVAEFATLGGYSAYVTAVPIVISMSAWNNLTFEQQGALHRAGDASTIYMEQNQREAEELAISRFAGTNVKVEAMKFDDYAAWATLAKDTAWKSYRATSPKAAELLNAMLRSFIAAGKAIDPPGTPPPK